MPSEEEAPKRSLAAILGVLIALGLVFGGVNEFGQRFLGLTALQSRDLFWWSLLPAIFLYVALVERRSFSSIGLHGPNWLTLIVAIGATALWVVVLTPAVNWVVAQIPSLPTPSGAPGQSIQDTPLWYRALLILRAATVEEALFRGYLITRISELTGSRALAVVVSIAAFTFAHLRFWGIAPLVAVAIAGAFLSALFLWRRDLISNMITHYLMDAVVVLL